MYKLYTRRNCSFCNAMKKELKALGVDYVEIASTKPSVPVLTDSNDKVIFKGLPKKQKLHDFFRKTS